MWQVWRESRGALQGLVGKYEGKNPMKDLGVAGNKILTPTT